MELYKHQEKAIEFLKPRQFAGLLMEMGTGKTLCILKHIVDNQLFPALIITKNSIKYNWLDEIQKFFPELKREVVVLEKDTRKKQKLLKEFNKKIYILNYESVRLLTLPNFKCCVLDESTAIKNPAAKVTKAVLAFAGRVPYRYILTGTPITNTPLDLFSQMKFLSSSIFEFENFYAFRAHYSILVERKMGHIRFKEVVGFKNMEELQERVKKHAYIIKKEQCLDLPEKIYEVRYVEMTETQKRIYNELKEYMIADAKKGQVVVVNVLSKILRLQQILGGVAVLEDGGVEKIEENKTKEVFEILEEVDGVKIVIWCRFIDEINRLHEELNKKGYKAAKIYGGVPIEERQLLISKFNETNEIQILVCQIATMGFGINLTGASVAIYYSNDWSLQNRQQSEDRLHRIGQKSKITIIDLVVRNTVETTILKALKEKKQFQDYIMNLGIENVLNLEEKGGEENE